jgi:hypothetical protein
MPARVSVSEETMKIHSLLVTGWGFKRAAILFAIAALPAFATTFTAPAYYVGIEDHIGGDYDYNDLIFTLTGAGLQLTSTNGSLNAPVVPNNDATPFWDRASQDGAGRNYGNCLYTPSVNNCAGSPIDPTAEYLAGPGGVSTDFSFTASGTVNLVYDIRFAGDVGNLLWCNGGGCTAITFSPNSPGGTASFDSTLGGGGTFWFRFVDVTTGGTTFNSNTVGGINNFAVSAAVPEPATFALVGGILLGLGGIGWRRRRRP